MVVCRRLYCSICNFSLCFCNFIINNKKWALDNWSGRILDAEILHIKSENFRCAIEASLYRQQLDGFLSTHNITELRYIADLWIRLLHSISCYTIGCQFVERNIITLVLELDTLKQLDRDSKRFIDCCLKI